MACFCSLCERSFPTRAGYIKHNSSYHRHPKPRSPPPVFRYHPHLNALPCDAEGVFLADPNAPPPVHHRVEGYEPFSDRASFERADLFFQKMAASKGDIEQLLRNVHAQAILDGHDPTTKPWFDSQKHLLSAIDAIKHGEAGWSSFILRYNGPLTPNSPAWKRLDYVVHKRDTLQVAENMSASPDFKHTWHTRPYEQFHANGSRVFSDIMSGLWAWDQADKIAQDPETHGSMFTPWCFATDKTTVSVATGHQEFHPLYMLSGNVTGEMRRAHREAAVPVAFLAIPTAEREWEDDPEFRLFKKQIYHTALRHILEPLRPGMTTPHVMLCPDGHHRRAIFGIGPIIADYPEQVYLSGIVQGWCPKCLALPDELDTPGVPRFREHTHQLCATFDPGELWDVFGVVNDVTPFTDYFPRADIHELLAPDLLHQLIKGTFKDHLVSWVEDYIRLTAPSARAAKRILDDIDRRIAAAPAFPGLRRFPQGRNFKQWTGNDSKALMKVFLPALSGYVPDKMIKCIGAFLDFAYLARRPSHDIETLDAMDAALSRFRELRSIFVETGVRPDGFSLPRQHALLHWTRMIKLFGSPNGVCTSISESKHIAAVKRPWRASNRNNPLIQILRTNTRLSKLAAMRVELGQRGLLRGDIVSYALRKVGLGPPQDRQRLLKQQYAAAQDVADIDGPEIQSRVQLPARPLYQSRITALASRLRVPSLMELLRRFLRDQLFPGFDEPDDEVPLAACPWLSPSTPIKVYTHATATFFAPSELCGPSGMHAEIIRCAPRWRRQHHRYDTVLVQVGDSDGMEGMVIGRVRAFLSFSHRITHYECVLLEWFETVGDEPDPVTGMWRVRPEKHRGQRSLSVVSVDTIVRSCHLIGVYGRTRIPARFHFSNSLDAFKQFYVNPYADYHTFELLKPLQ